MAAETTTTTLTELVNSEFIRDQILDYAHDFVVNIPYCAEIDLRGKASGVAAVPQWVKDAAADIADEVTALTNTALETTEVTITTAEMGILREVTKNALEDSKIGLALLDFIVRDAARLLSLALEDDVVALFSSLATSVGTSGANLTLANMIEAVAQIRKNGVRAPGGLVFGLDDQQADDYDAAVLASTSTTVNNYVQRQPNGGVDNGMLGTFSGHLVVQSGLNDTANTGANVVGACYVRGDVPANAGYACFGLAISRMPDMDEDKNIALRSRQVAVTARWAPAEIFDLAGCGIITDA